MELTYFGHSCFSLKSRSATVVTDPFSSEVGWSLPKLTADIVTVSHDHYDHAATEQIKGTTRRDAPMVIKHPGEYEVQGVSVFGYRTFHDDKSGEERGANTIYLIVFDQLRICHLGDLGHQLSDDLIEQLGHIDILLLPVGGTYTIDAAGAAKVVTSLEPGIVVPMHYRLPQHAANLQELAPLEAFQAAYGAPKATEAKLSLDQPIEEETSFIVLEPQVK
jgi:L-ascorbate metabolism protein UlaG (beta-lactamase superfamily)